MAKFPGPQTVERIVPSAPTVRLSVPDARFVPGGMGEVGDALFRAGLDLDQVNREREERLSRFQLAQAKSAFTQERIRIEAGINDNDHGTFVSRFQEGASKARDALAQGINDPESRALFGAWANIDLTQGSANMHARALKKERDFGVASLNQGLDDLLRNVPEAEDEQTRGLFIQNGRDLIGAAVVNQYISAKEGQGLLDAFKVNYAKTRLAGMSDQETVEAFKQRAPWTKLLTSRERAEALAKAEKGAKVENDKQTALARYDALRAKHGGDWEKIKGEADQIADYEQRLIVHTLNDKELRRQEVLKERQKEEQDQEVSEFISGGGSYTDLPPEVTSNMSPSERRAAIQLEATMDTYEPPWLQKEKWDFYYDLTDRAETDPGVLLDHSLTELAGMLPKEKINEVRKNRSAVRDQRNNGVFELQLEGDSEALKAIMADTSRALGITGSGDAAVKKRGLFREELRKAVERERTVKARALLPDEIRGIRDRLVQEVATTNGWWRSKDPLFLLLESDERLESLVVPDEARQAIVRSYMEKKGGVRPSGLTIKRIYAHRLVSPSSAQ